MTMRRLFIGFFIKNVVCEEKWVSRTGRPDCVRGAWEFVTGPFRCREKRYYMTRNVLRVCHRYVIGPEVGGKHLRSIPSHTFFLVSAILYEKPNKVTDLQTRTAGAPRLGVREFR